MSHKVPFPVVVARDHVGLNAHVTVSYSQVTPQCALLNVFTRNKLYQVPICLICRDKLLKRPIDQSFPVIAFPHSLTLDMAVTQMDQCLRSFQ